MNANLMAEKSLRRTVGLNVRTRYVKEVSAKSRNLGGTADKSVPCIFDAGDFLFGKLQHSVTF